MTRSILFKYPWKTSILTALAVGVGTTYVQWSRGTLPTAGSLLIYGAFMTLGPSLPVAIYALLRLGNRNRKPITFPLNEAGAVEGAASLAGLAGLPTSGWFILSEDDLKFFSRSRKRDVAIPLKQISTVERSVLPYALKFQLEDGSSYSFTVGDREQWLEELDHARSAQV